MLLFRFELFDLKAEHVGSLSRGKNGFIAWHAKREKSGTRLEQRITPKGWHHIPLSVCLLKYARRFPGSIRAGCQGILPCQGQNPWKEWNFRSFIRVAHKRSQWFMVHSLCSLPGIACSCAHASSRGTTPSNRVFKIVFKFMRRPALLPTASWMSATRKPELTVVCLTEVRIILLSRLMDIGFCVFAALWLNDLIR